MAPGKLLGANLVLLFLVLLLDRSVRLVQELALAGISVVHLGPLVVAMSPFSLNLAFPAAFGLTMVMTIDRLTREREIESMAGLGLPPWRIVAPMVLFGLATAAANLLVSGWLEPLGRHAYRQQMALARHEIDLATFQPRAIYNPHEGLMLTAGAVAGKALGNVLVWSREEGGGDEFLASARSGMILAEPGSNRLTLAMARGRMVVIRPSGQGRQVVSEFDRLAQSLSLSPETAGWPRGKDEKELTLPELAGSAPAAAGRVTERARVAELWQRVARAFTMPLMPLLILPMLAGNPPGRRGPAVFAIAGLMMLAHHGINLAKDLGVAGAGPAAGPQLAMFAAMAAVTLAVWLAGRRQPGETPLRFLSRIRLPGLRRSDGQPRPHAGLIRRLIAGDVLRSSLAVLLFMTAVLQVIDLIEAGDTLVASGSGVAGLGRFLMLRAPPAMLQALPIAALGGPLLAFFKLRDSRQLMIVQTLGFSAFRILAIASASAFALAVLGFVLAERLAPRAELAFVEWWRGVEQAAGKTDEPEARWFRVGGEIVRIARASGDGATLVAPMIIRRDDDGLVVARLAASRATYESDGWRLHDVEIRRFGTNPRTLHYPERLWRAPIDPADVRRLATASRQQEARQIARVLEAQAPSDRAEAFYATRLAHLWAFPVMPLVMLVLAMPVVFASQQPRRIARSMVLTGLAGLCFLVVDGVMRIVGSLGLAPPLVAVWSAPLLFFLFGLRALLGSERVS